MCLSRAAAILVMLGLSLDTPRVGAADALFLPPAADLQQVLLNLVPNGMEAMAETPSERRRLLVRTSSNNGQIDVLVKDTGAGIPADAAADIFEPFFTTKTDGMGMGLSISRSIVEAHGGRIVAENNTEGGATVGFSVPLRHVD